jgi:anaphase-promoting complex subunit 2
LGEDKLQACEVMLRDVLESKRINTSVKSVAARDAHLELNAQILSRFFWPALRDDTFLVPAEVQSLQTQYARGFERVKDMRKLEWLPSLGRASVELQFEDRTIELDVQLWQASVIYAFQNDDSSAEQSPRRTVEELEELLEMDESLVRNALSFWVGKRALAEVSEDTFAVLERLDTEGNNRPNEAAAALAAEEAEAEAVSAVRSQEDMLLANMDLYRQFISGMLLNQGSMPASKILMMMKMVFPGGFPFGVDEVRTVLGKMVEEGNLVGTGDIYSVRKGEN